MSRSRHSKHDFNPDIEKLKLAARKKRIPQELGKLAAQVLALLPEPKDDNQPNRRILSKILEDGRIVNVFVPSTEMGKYTVVVLPVEDSGDTIQYSWAPDGTKQEVWHELAVRHKFDLSDIDELTVVIKALEERRPV